MIDDWVEKTSSSTQSKLPVVSASFASLDMGSCSTKYRTIVCIERGSVKLIDSHVWLLKPNNNVQTP